MSTIAVNNYLSGLVSYYQIAQVSQAVSGGGGGGAHSIPFIPIPIGLGGGGNHGGSNVHVHGGVDVLRENRQNEREDREENRATTAAWVGGILTIIASAGLACVASRWTAVRDRLTEAHEFKEEQIPLMASGPQKNDLMCIVNKDIKILEKKVSQSRNIVILTGLVLASAIAAFAGGMMASQWLITAAIVTGVIGLALGAFAAVWYCMQKSETLNALIEAYEKQYGPIHA